MTVKGVDGFAVVLDSYIVDVNQGYPGIQGLPGKNTVALVVLAGGKGRAGDVDKEVYRTVLLVYINGLEIIFVTPAILTQNAAKLNRLSGNRKLDWL